METDWKWKTFEPIERKIAQLLVHGKGNAAICAQVFLSRARVQECIKRILIKTGADTGLPGAPRWEPTNQTGAGVLLCRRRPREPER